MPEAIAVDGFNIPPAPAGAVTHSREGVPPANMQPGFVPPAPAPAQPAPAAPAPAAPAALPPEGLAALLAALGASQPAPAAPAAPAAAPAPYVAPVSSGANDPMLSSMTAILSSSGLDVQRAIGNALAHGDASLIDGRYIAEAGGANAQHLKNIAEGLVNHAVRESEAAEQAVYAAAGGQANWHAALGSFEQIAPPHLKTVIKNLFDSGDRTSIDAATKTVLEFARASGGFVQPAGLVQAGAGAAQGQALDKAGFQVELRKLNPQAPGYEQQRAELFQRRQLGKNMGR